MTIIAETKVQYNPSGRKWVVSDDASSDDAGPPYNEAIVIGDIALFPAGPENKSEAQLHALERDAPDVADEVKATIANVANHPQADAITGRAIEAGFLIRDRKVFPPVPFDQPGGCINEIARVQGSQDEPYIVGWDGEHCWCDCPDFMLENVPVLPSGQPVCQHILAVLIVEALQEDDPEDRSIEEQARAAWATHRAGDTYYRTNSNGQLEEGRANGDGLLEWKVSSWTYPPELAVRICVSNF